MDMNSVLSELQKYKNTDKEEVLTTYISERLNESLRSYYSELDKSITFLGSRDDLKVLKKINSNRLRSG